MVLAVHRFFLLATPARHLPKLLLTLVLAGPAVGQDAPPGEIVQASCGENRDGGPAECNATPPEASTAAPGEQSGTTASHNLDWVELRDVPVELVDKACRICSGRYIDPLGNLDMPQDPESSAIEATAVATEIEGNTIRLIGGVTVQQGYRYLRADNATIARDQQSAELEGAIELREPGVLVLGDRAAVLSDTGEVMIDVSRFILHQQHLRGAAGQLERDAQGLIYIHDGELSFCAPNDDHWALRAEEMKLDLEEGLGTARGAKFDVAGVPIFYFPWIQFPLDDRRRSGLLVPDIGSDTRGGLDVSMPIYLNLAPNYDALYAPRYIQERGISHELELRYLNRQLGYWAASGAFLGDDERYRDEVPEQGSYDRWGISLQHQAMLGQRWRSRVDYGKVSDVDYLKDLDSSSLNTKRQVNLLQLGSLDYLGDSWLVNMELQQFQQLNEDIITNNYKKLPQITAQYRSSLAPFQLEPIAQAQYSYFDSDDDRVTGHRLYAEGGLAYPMQWTQGFFKPKVKYRHLQYDLNGGQLPREEDRPSSGGALVSLDGGLYFDRSTRLAGRGLLQTLEPRVYYLYADYEDQRANPDFDTAELTFNYNQLFRETRFSGRDRLDDANQFSLGVTTRFISEEDGREQFSASLGQIIYLRDRRVRLQALQPPLDSSTSELAAEVRFAPTERMNLRASVVWDPDSGDVNAGNFNAGYIRNDDEIYNIGYTFRRPLTLIGDQPVTEQLHVSAFVPVRDNWNLFFSWNYSIEAGTSVEDMVGVEYDTCCWKVRLLHLRYFDTVPGGTNDFTNPDLERERSTQVQIILKGLGGFGDRIEGLLEDMIRGYEDREY